MGIFFDKAPRPDRGAVTAAIRDALERDPGSVGDLNAEADARATRIAPDGDDSFKTGRFLGALAIFTAIVVAAIVTDATGLDDSSAALWGFAATIFGVVVGFLAGEKSAAS